MQYAKLKSVKLNAVEGYRYKILQQAIWLSIYIRFMINNIKITLKIPVMRKPKKLK